MQNLVPSGESVCEERWKESLISKLSCSPKGSGAAAVQQLPAFPKQPLRPGCVGFAEGSRSTAHHLPPQPQSPCSSLLACCGMQPDRFLLFQNRCISLQVRRLPGTRGFSARWSAGENRNLSSVARGKGEKLRSPGTGCGAASGELHAGHSLS